MKKFVPLILVAIIALWAGCSDKMDTSLGPAAPPDTTTDTIVRIDTHYVIDSFAVIDTVNVVDTVMQVDTVIIMVYEQIVDTLIDTLWLTKEYLIVHDTSKWN